MERTCVYTCITGNYDNIHEIKRKEKNIDYFLFTNNKKLTSKTWKVIYIEDDKLDNQRLSRKIKMLGHPIINEKYDVSIWMDASVIFEKSITEFVSKYLKKAPFVSFKHYERDCIYEESKECIRTKKDKKEAILKQMDFLKKEGYPEHNGLCEMTVFIKRHKDKIVKKTMEDWFYMICNYSKRDQLSFMYCAWKNKLKIDIIPLSVWDNDWFINQKHNIKEKLTTCRFYYGNDRNFNPELDDQVDFKKINEHYTVESVVADNTEVIEIELTDIPAIEYKNIKIKGINPTNMFIFNTINFNEKKVFYANYGLIKLVGNFKKGKKIKVEVDLHKLEQIELYELIEYLGANNIEEKEKSKRLTEELDSIKNSKSWKLLEKLRRMKSR